MSRPLNRNSINIEDYRDLSNHEGIVYEFCTERGMQKISYAEYLADVKLRAMVNDQSRYRLIMGRTIFSYPLQHVRARPSLRNTLNELEDMRYQNPLRYFAPSGVELTNFLNDYDNTLCILTAPNRVGKSQTNIIKKLINNMPTDPSWEIFTKYGVKYRPFKGERNVGVASYELGFHDETIMPMILDWAPRSELGAYAKEYGKGQKRVVMKNDPTLPFTCGSRFCFAAMTQSQGRFEGNVRPDWAWDEQGTEEVFDGADERTRQHIDGRHDFAMTPHKVAGRPDTGAGSWISKIFSGEMTKGHKVKTYKAQVWDIPDWIYPEASKEKAFKKWVVEPIKLQNEKIKREGAARFFGKWHESSGMVIDEWDSSKHVIEPFEIPKHWSRCRAVDHGSVHPAACLWGAVSPAGDLFLYRDMLRVNLITSQIVDEIITLSGNSRKKVGSYKNPLTGNINDEFKEVCSSESYLWTKFDARAFSKQVDETGGILLSRVYQMAGLNVTKGSGHDSDHYVPILKEWFYVDPKKKHFATKELGAPRVYVFNTCVDFIKTIKRWVWQERKTTSTTLANKESPTKKEDDLCDCMKLMIQANPAYRGNPMASDKRYYDDFDEDVGTSRKRVRRKPRCSLTGY